MALPKPNKGESKDAFIARSIQDADMLSNFPVPAMRSAVTNTLWFGYQKNIKLTANGLKVCALYKCPKCGETYAHAPDAALPELCMVCNTEMQEFKDHEPNPKLKNNLAVCMSNLIRNETLEGKEYLVVPVVMMVEGVHNNLLYGGDELGMFPDAWNGKPVVVRHPMEGGQFVTANTPQREESVTIGEVYNTIWDSTKLKCEAWIDPVKANKVDPQIMTMLQASQHIEVSISAFTEDEMTEGDFGAEHYVGIVHNLRPDHLAFLPDEEGACNWQDGAGAPRVNENTERKEKGDGIMLVKHKDGGLCALLKDALGVSATLKGNELSHDDLRSRLATALRAGGMTDNEGIYIRDVYDKFVVFEHMQNDNYKLYKQAYATDANENVSLSGDRVEVQVSVEYVPVAKAAQKQDGNAQKGNQKQEGSNSMDRKTMVAELIANGAWADSDTEFLSGMEDAHFAKIHAAMKTAAKTDDEVETEEQKVAAKDVTNKVAPVVPVDAVPKTVDEYIAGAPDEMKEVLSSSVALHRTRKQGLVKELMACSRNKFTEVALSAKTIDELEGLCELADVPVSFEGRGLQTAQKANAEDDGMAEAMPAMDFTKKS